MTEKHLRGPLSRRGFLAGAAGLTGATIVGARLAGSVPVRAATDLRAAAAGTHPQKSVHLVGTDGWVSMPQGAPADPPFFPDSLAPDPFNTYVFGFRNVTGLTPTRSPRSGARPRSAPRCSPSTRRTTSRSRCRTWVCSSVPTSSTATRCTGTAS